MKAIQTRVYTNVILTVIAMFLAVLAFRPVLDFTTNAYAQRDRSTTPDRDLTEGLPDEFARQGVGPDATFSAGADQAEAQRDIAEAIRDLAEAVRDGQDAAREAASAQQAIADAISGLGEL